MSVFAKLPLSRVLWTAIRLPGRSPEITAGAAHHHGTALPVITTRHLETERVNQASGCGRNRRSDQPRGASCWLTDWTYMRIGTGASTPLIFASPSKTTNGTRNCFAAVVPATVYARLTDRAVAVPMS